MTAPSPPGCPDSLHRERPANQAAYHEWVLAVFRRVFQCEKQPEGPMVTLEAPKVKGLTVYAAKCGETRFYGAWIERSGVFIGWTRKLRTNRAVQLLSASKGKLV